MWWIAIIFLIHIFGFFVPIIAKIILSLDYLIVLMLVWFFLLTGFNYEAEPTGLLGGVEIHTVFIILICLAILVAWWGLQQIEIKGIKIFKILACVGSTLIFVFLLRDDSFFNFEIDIIWTWTIAIIYFGISLLLRTRDFVEDLLF